MSRIMTKMSRVSRTSASLASGNPMQEGGHDIKDCMNWRSRFAFYAIVLLLKALEDVVLQLFMILSLIKLSRETLDQRIMCCTLN